MRKMLLVVAVFLATPAFAGKEGAPRVLPKAGLLGKVTGISVHWQRVPLADGKKGLRADVYRRDGEGSFVLKKTVVTGTHKNGVKFTNTRDYVPVGERIGYAPGERAREAGKHRVDFDQGGKQSKTDKRGLSAVTTSMTRSISLLTAILTDRVDTMDQHVRFTDGTTRTRFRYGFKDATVETLGDKGVERPFAVVK
jgi:hypothetical protein